VSRKLYPNVDFYSGIIYSALGIPRSMFTVMFAIARTAGWVAQLAGMVSDPHMRIGPARQLYTGPTAARLSDDRKALIDGGATLRDILRRPGGAAARRRRNVRSQMRLSECGGSRRPQQCADGTAGAGSRQHTLPNPSPRFAPSAVAKLALKWAFG